jgi:hypothetical protein
MASSSDQRYLDDMPRRDSIDDAPEGSGLLSQDPEKQSTSISHSSQPHEDTVSTNKKLAYLAGYFICNIGLTLYNKAILGSVRPLSLFTSLRLAFSCRHSTQPYLKTTTNSKPSSASHGCSQPSTPAAAA